MISLLQCYQIITLFEPDGRKEVFYLTTHSTHLVMVIWRRIEPDGGFENKKNKKKYIVVICFHLLLKVWGKFAGN